MTGVGGVRSGFAIESRGVDIAGELLVIGVTGVLSTFAVEDRGASIVESREIFFYGGVTEYR